MSTPELLDQIEMLISENEIPKAIKQLKTLVKGSPFLDELIVQSSRYNDVMRKIRMDTISYEKSNQTQNQISTSLLEMVQIFRTGAQNDTHIYKEIERIAQTINNITITNSKNIVLGDINSGGGNVNIGDTIINETKDGQIEWSNISIYKDLDGQNESHYQREINGNIEKITPYSTLQKTTNWPGKYRMEFPLCLDLKFINTGDKSELINAIEIVVHETQLDNQVAFEPKPSINENGNLILSLENYGYGENRVIMIEPFSEKAAVYWDIKNNAFKAVKSISGHTHFEFTPNDAPHLKTISTEELNLLNEKRNLIHPSWTPNPIYQTFEGYDDNQEELEENEFSILRKKLISENKILDSSSFFGNIVFEENNTITERKLYWGFIQHRAYSSDLIKTEKGFELINYQEPLAYLPPSMEYQAQLSVNDKGRTISIEASQVIKGGDVDRVLLNIEPMECLFATIEIIIKCSGNVRIPYPKKIDLNLLKFKDNGDFSKEQGSIKTTKFKYDAANGILL